MVPRIGIESIVPRMDSTATLSDSPPSPRPIVRADAIAAFSTTRINLGARSLSMFSPKLLALISTLVSVAITASRWRLETIARFDAEVKGGMADGTVGKAVGSGQWVVVSK